MFESEQEAFAAAEETYRAYIDAVNAEQQGSPASTSRDYLVGLALQGDTDTRRTLDEQGLRLEGAGSVASFTREAVDITGTVPTVTAVACLDLSSTRVLNAEGADVTPADRPQFAALRVSLLRNLTDFQISESTLAEDATC